MSGVQEGCKDTQKLRRHKSIIKDLLNQEVSCEIVLEEGLRGVNRSKNVNNEKSVWHRTRPELVALEDLHIFCLL